MVQLQLIQSRVTDIWTNNQTAISSIILAIEMIVRFCKKLKYKRRIVLVTNGKNPMDSGDLEHIVSKVKSEGIELVVLWVISDCYPLVMGWGD